MISSVLVCMEHLLNSIGTFVGKQGRHSTYIVDWNLIKPIVKKWSRNRDPDMERVQELLIHVQNGGYIPFILHLADLKDEGLVCYDGNHRREALNHITANMPRVIVNILSNATQKEVYDAFDSLNKSVQVPAIYFEDEHTIKNVKEEILALVKRYEGKYKDHLSPSPRCHAPQFNRDTFIENLHKIWKHFDGKVSIADIENALEQLNIMYSQGRLCKPHECYKHRVTDKCKETGLWLFIDRDISVEHIGSILKM